ncbi:MAG: bifunctional oligoribonuclease/PAP phosphatase NrnA [Actinomycetota bacterium]|nr:bifunctional oligoribonuclease/PAP phosphatase NrnA [Actinomycetota bacterium]
MTTEPATFQEVEARGSAEGAGGRGRTGSAEGAGGRGRTGDPPSWVADIAEEEWKAAVERIHDAGESGAAIALACHADPDGDALGSLLAAHLFLRKLGYYTVASWGNDPFVVPPQYTFLHGLHTLVPPHEFPHEPELLLTFDVGCKERLGLLASAADRAHTLVVVDHHESNDRFGDVNLVAQHAAATVVLVDELVRRLGGSPDRDIAACLYTGLVTDTGRFQYRNVDRSTMELGSRLIAEGIEHAEISRQMFDTHSFGYLKVLGRVLTRSTFVPEASLVYSWVEQADLDRFGVALEETEGLIDVLRSADAAEVTMVMKELADGDWRVSLRSKGRTDVGSLAREFGGGGHSFSAGFVVSGSRETTVSRVVKLLAGRER